MFTYIIKKHKAMIKPKINLILSDLNIVVINKIKQIKGSIIINNNTFQKL